VPRRYPAEFRCQVIELARSGTKVKQLAATFQMSEVTIYNWLKQERIDRGEAEGATTSQQLELAADKRRIRQPKTSLTRDRCNRWSPARCERSATSSGQRAPRGTRSR
jgi:transposase-like protein